MRLARLSHDPIERTERGAGIGHHCEVKPVTGAEADCMLVGALSQQLAIGDPSSFQKTCTLINTRISLTPKIIHRL